MSKIETGGPAFPVSTSNETDGHQDGPNTWQFPGMTLRDFFAAKVMQAAASTMLSDQTITYSPQDAAREAYKFADAMLSARKGMS